MTPARTMAATVPQVRSAMTDRARTAAPRRPRLSKRALRAWAWLAGAAALSAPLGALAAHPKVTTTHAAPRPVIVQKVLRRVIVVSPRKQPSQPEIVYVSGGTSAGGGAPAPAPTTTTGGSGVPK
jgi:hypothetical protein